MEDRDYRSEVGKKIEEALANGDFDLIEDLIEVPPMETFMQWAEKGEEKRKKRICRKRILVSCLAIVVVSASVLIGLKCFALPEVTADPEDSMVIDINDMEGIVIYESWKDIPDEVKEDFVEVKDLPEGYEIKKYEVGEGSFGTKITIYIMLGKEEIQLRQYSNGDGCLPTNTVNGTNEEMLIEDLIVYVEDKEGIETTTYKYLIEDIIIDIKAPNNITKDDVKTLIKTVQ